MLAVGLDNRHSITVWRWTEGEWVGLEMGAGLIGLERGGATREDLWQLL